MKRIVWTYGLIGGVIVGILMAVGTTLYREGVVSLDWGELIGYSSMVLAFLMVFFGVRAYRDGRADEAFSFGRAVKVGILITLVICAVYVLVWEVLYFTVANDFTEVYAAHVIEKLEAEGASAVEIAAMEQKIARFAELYDNPLINAAITFLEIFPVGLVMTLLSAAILRRRERRRVNGAAAAI